MRLSLPLIQVDLALCRQDFVETGIKSPTPDQIREVRPLRDAHGRFGQLIQY